ncbi:MAG: UDP-N-acetylmuramate dehydrogenase [Alphaproteobacteria bacterium]
MAAMRDDPLINRLPPVRGRLAANAPLGPMTWFRTGGPAEVLFRPADEDDLSSFLSALPADVPVTVLGVASNLLVRDGGIAGIVIRLGRRFASVTVDNERVSAGAGALDRTVALTAAAAGLSGLEFLYGVPGTIGGALRMNAGAYGREMVDVVVQARTMDRQGQAHVLSPADLGLTYRRSSLPQDWIILDTTLSGAPAARTEIEARMADIARQREESQPVRARTGGSTFANPTGEKAWRLIEQAGCRGLRIGDAMVSEKHCNFIINLGQASAADIENLGEEVRRRVEAASGIGLRWEIRRIGAPLPGTLRQDVPQETTP